MSAECQNMPKDNSQSKIKKVKKIKFSKDKLTQWVWKGERTFLTLWEKEWLQNSQSNRTCWWDAETGSQICSSVKQQSVNKTVWSTLWEQGSQCDALQKIFQITFKFVSLPCMAYLSTDIWFLYSRFLSRFI